MHPGKKLHVGAGGRAATCSAIHGAVGRKSHFYVVEKGGQGNERTIITKREGASGISYSKRLYNCAEHTVKYLGTGDSLAAMAVSAADPSMAPIVEGSTAYYVGLQACG